MWVGMRVRSMESWLRRGCSLEFGCRPIRACFVNPFYSALWVLAHIPKPQAHWLLLVQVGPRGGSGAFLVDYTICFSFSVFVLVRGGGEVLFCCWG